MATHLTPGHFACQQVTKQSLTEYWSGSGGSKGLAASDRMAAALSGCNAAADSASACCCCCCAVPGAESFPAAFWASVTCRACTTSCCNPHAYV